MTLDLRAWTRDPRLAGRLSHEVMAEAEALQRWGFSEADTELELTRPRAAQRMADPCQP